MMLNLLCREVEKIVFSGVNGTILILPLFILLWFMWGQAKDCIEITKRVLEEDRVASKDKILLKAE